MAGGWQWAAGAAPGNEMRVWQHWVGPAAQNARSPTRLVVAT